MHTTLNNYINDLTKNDKKSLTEKMVKLFEEGGELAKAILPFEGVYTANHKLVNKRKLLEEIADIHLVNQSILYSLGFTDDEFEKMVFEKARIWNNLQVKEDRALAKSEKMPFEIHITVSTDAKDGIDILKFSKHCTSIDVKPIVLDLQDKYGSVIMHEVMTSSKLYGSNKDAFSELNRISSALTSFGYNVVREKIESAFFHTKAPFRSDGDSIMPDGCYFECHFNVICTQDDLNNLTQIANSTDCHLSKNIFKKFDDGSFTIMLTYRSYEKMYEDFEKHLTFIKHSLQSFDLSIEKEIVEFSIYDTKTSHDSIWLGKNNAT